jgi:hypothetical protein
MNEQSPEFSLNPSTLPSASHVINFDLYSLRDLVGYEVFLESMEAWGLPHRDGDLIEIGAFVGGGTAKLARAAKKWGKSVFTVDLFEPASDTTVNQAGHAMCAIYDWILGGRSQEELFYDTIKGLDNVKVFKTDSRLLRFSSDQRFVFGFIDGNHDPEAVKSDFSLLWPHMTPGGVLAFHDYGGDLPQTTAAIDEMLDCYGSSIEKCETLPEKWILLVFKK